jgi:hypothetical protein
MNIADSFYVALCMTVLLLGVVYWFWTQTQYLQRKINLLENIVYEIKTSVDSAAAAAATASAAATALPSVPTEGPLTEAPEAKYPPAPGSELGEDEDLLHEKLLSEEAAPVPDELQPGGVGSGVSDAPPLSETQKPRGNVLDGMTLKELRRLGEQRNIPGASNMRKQALIEALRAEPRPQQESQEDHASPVATIQVGTVSPFEENVVELQ